MQRCSLFDDIDVCFRVDQIRREVIDIEQTTLPAFPNSTSRNGAFMQRLLCPTNGVDRCDDGGLGTFAGLGEDDCGGQCLVELKSVDAVQRAADLGHGRVASFDQRPLVLHR